MFNIYYSLFIELLEEPLLLFLYSFSNSYHYGPYGQLFVGELNFFALQVAKQQDLENGADLNQEMQSGDEINRAVLDG